MSDLRELLHQIADDVSAPDLSGRAWRDGNRTRRRRAAAAVAAAGAAVVVSAVGIIAVVTGPETPGPAPAPTHSPSPTTPTSPSAASRTASPSPANGRPERTRPDAHYAGWPVWWAPTLAEEAELPTYARSPYPASIDIADPDAYAGALGRDHRLDHALAAFGDPDTGTVAVLDPEGRLWSLDVSRAEPMSGPDGASSLRLGPSLLSRGGDYILIPQEGSVLLYSLGSGTWRTVDTGNADTWDATWIRATQFVLADPSRPFTPAPLYTASGRLIGADNVIGSGVPEVPYGDSQLLGRSRTGTSIAQALTPGAPLPAPPGDAPGDDVWIATKGNHSDLLVIPGDVGRSGECCDVGGWVRPDTVLYESPQTIGDATGLRLVAWQVDTGRFWQVTQVTGATTGSYAQLIEPFI